MSYSNSNMIIQSNLNENLIYNCQQIKDLTTQIHHKNNRINELDKRIQQIITIKDMVIYSLERRIKELEKSSE